MIEAVVLLGLAAAGATAIGACALPVATGVLTWGERRRRRLRERLRRRAAALGLRPVGVDRWLVPVRGADALLCFVAREGELVPCLAAEVPTGRLRLRPRRDPLERLSVPDPALGDAIATGPSEDRAALTGEVRAAIAAARRCGEVGIGRGILGLYLLGVGPGFERLEDGLALFGRILAALERVPADPVERLARMAAHDPVPAMRAMALARLGLAWPDEEATHAVARRLRDDPDLEVRTEAARIVGDRQRLVRLAVDPRAPRSVRGRAARALDHARARPALAEIEALLASDDPQVRRSGVRLARERGREAEPLLLRRLAPDELLVAAIVEALGDLGTVRALEPLRQLRAAASAFGSLRGLAGAAIERIRNRERPRHGGLSVAPAGAGALAIAERIGALAEVEPP